MEKVLPHSIDTIDALKSQSSRLEAQIAMLHCYFESSPDGGDTLSDEVMCNYLWQMQHTVSEMKEALEQISAA